VKLAGVKMCVVTERTDGIDGNRPAVCALAYGTTIARAREAGCDVKRTLESFDSYSLFGRLGDAIVTGPTGNNVRDVRILVAY